MSTQKPDTIAPYLAGQAMMAAISEDERVFLFSLLEMMGSLTTQKLSTKNLSIKGQIKWNDRAQVADDLMSRFHGLDKSSLPSLDPREIVILRDAARRVREQDAYPDPKSLGCESIDSILTDTIDKLSSLPR